MMNKTLYELLEVSPDANSTQIDEAVKRLSEKYTSTNQANGVTFDEIQAAYQILSSPYRRTAYDIALEEEILARQKQQGLKTKFFKRWQPDQQSPITTSAYWSIILNNLQTSFRKGEHLIKRWVIRMLRKGQRFNWLKSIFARKVDGEQKKTVAATSLILNEVIMYQSHIHWLFCLDIGAIVLICLTSYLLIDDPYSLKENTPVVTLWLPKQWMQTLPQVSVWTLGLTTLLFVGLMMLLEVFIEKQTTELVVTSKRIIATFGFINRKIVEISLTGFESVTVNQSILGKFFNYGTLTVISTSRIKATVPHVIAPLRFRQVIWRLLE